MAEYYLISQLPSLDGIGDGTAIPITEESFFELCSRFLNQKVLSKLRGLKLAPPVEETHTESELINAWNRGERELRFALAVARAGKMNKELDFQVSDLPADLVRIAAAAIDISNPLEAEKFLLQHRLRFLESLRPMDSFSEDYLYYYALRLKLILRIRRFDAAVGESTYKNIYDSILDGAHMEAE